MRCLGGAARSWCKRRLLPALVLALAWSGSGAGVRAAARVPVGEQAPDFTLTTTEGEELRLSRLGEKGPVVLTFVRAHW